MANQSRAKMMKLIRPKSCHKRRESIANTATRDSNYFNNGFLNRSSVQTAVSHAYPMNEDVFLTHENINF